MKIGLGAAAGVVTLIAAVTLSPHPATEVVYYVEGTATVASITYATPTGIRQQENIDVPVTLQGSATSGLPVDGFSSRDRVYISAQRQDEFGGGSTVTCRIEVNGSVVSENTSEGDYAVVQCSGSV